MNIKRRIAYFSMEIGLDPSIPTYSGGLGILAGDTIKSCADLKAPMVAVTLLYRKGYFNQVLDGNGSQKEMPVEWKPQDLLKQLPNKVNISIEGRDVAVGAWQYDVISSSGYTVPVIFLDTDLPENSESDRRLNYFLYGGDLKYRLSQEIILGIGGIRMLHSLGYTEIRKYHMNEGHASLLTLELLNRLKKEQEAVWDFDAVRDMCVFTTHTPVPAGHDQFPYDLVKEVLGEIVPYGVMGMFGGGDRLNMTLLALNLSRFVNGVAEKHKEVSMTMFPGYHIESITNGVHSHTWTSDPFRRLFDKYIPGWVNDPFSLRYALNIPKIDVWSAHAEAKRKLIDYMDSKSVGGFDSGALTIGFARRFATYKRADLIFHDVERLINISKYAGRIQFIFAGKAHPNDEPGKDMIRKIFSDMQRIKDHIKIVYLDNYDMYLAKLLVAGVDLWLNTPQRPKEASGTSGMKAAHNGVPSLSILDGWWLEGHIEDVTGWSIGPKTIDAQSDTERDAQEFYDKMEKKIVPMFYNNRDKWIDIMQHSIALNASFFNTHRMVLQYVLNSYLY